MEYLREITQACYSKIEGRLAKYELVKGQAHLLTLIRDNDGCTQKDLANAVGVRYSSMSERLNKLERNGYIFRESDSDNLKYKRIFITPEGKTAVVQCRRILREWDEVLYNGFTKKDIKQLEDYLERMVDNVSK